MSGFEIRSCRSCGLRYPLADNHPFGTRCPHCMGETQVILRREVTPESETRSPAPVGNFAVVLDNIRSAWNVGSILRSADGFGFGRVYLCGITPTPEHQSVRKTSLGAENSVHWSYHNDAVKLVKQLNNQGWEIFALEEDARAESISRVRHSPARAALILGSETCGVDPELLDFSDKILSIPMRGQKHSFNVANAFSIAAYALTIEHGV